MTGRPGGLPSEVYVLEQPGRFGPELRRRRLGAGLSLGQLAQRVHYSKAQLSKVERELKAPSSELARLCDTALGAGGALSSRTPPARTPTTEPRADADQEVWAMELSAGAAGSSFRPLDRRRMMVAGATSAVGLSLSAPAAAAESAGTNLLDTARSLFDHYRRLGQGTAPEVLLPVLIAQTHTLRELSAHTSPSTRGRLLTLASRYAEYIGWLVQETGNDRAALWWTDRAVDMASAGGDPDLAAYALVRRGLIALYRGDGPRTVALAQQAQNSRSPARIRGLAIQREAQGHALAGDEAACMRSLERAGELFVRGARDAGSPVIGTTALADPVAMIRGWCLYDLGRPREAARVIDREIGGVPRNALRAQARFGARRALAYAAAGEIEHACALAEGLLDSADAVDSATVRTDLRRLARTLARHPRCAAVRALLPALSASLYPPAPPTP